MQWLLPNCFTAFVFCLFLCCNSLPVWDFLLRCPVVLAAFKYWCHQHWQNTRMLSVSTRKTHWKLQYTSAHIQICSDQFHRETSSSGATDMPLSMALCCQLFFSHLSWETIFKHTTYFTSHITERWEHGHYRGNQPQNPHTDPLDRFWHTQSESPAGVMRGCKEENN